MLLVIGLSFYLGKKAKSLQDGEKIAKNKIETGEAYKKFLEIVMLQGGDINYIINTDKYPKSNFTRKVRALKNGFIKEMDTYSIGMASLELGAGRRTKDDVIDHKAGIIFYKKTGDYILKNEIICELFSDSKSRIKLAEQMILQSIKFSNSRPRKQKLVKKLIR